MDCDGSQGHWLGRCPACDWKLLKKMSIGTVEYWYSMGAISQELRDKWFDEHHRILAEKERKFLEQRG